MTGWSTCCHAARSTLHSHGNAALATGAGGGSTLEQLRACLRQMVPGEGIRLGSISEPIRLAWEPCKGSRSALCAVLQRAPRCPPRPLAGGQRRLPSCGVWRRGTTWPRRKRSCARWCQVGVCMLAPLRLCLSVRTEHAVVRTPGACLPSPWPRCTCCTAWSPVGANWLVHTCCCRGHPAARPARWWVGGSGCWPAARGRGALPGLGASRGTIGGAGWLGGTQTVAQCCALGCKSCFGSSCLTCGAMQRGIPLVLESHPARRPPARFRLPLGGWGPAPVGSRCLAICVQPGGG